ncbi:hypothetical protein DL93DRAFT_2084718, partial [Clavulina sp. PMI_390]
MCLHKALREFMALTENKDVIKELFISLLMMKIGIAPLLAYANRVQNLMIFFILPPGASFSATEGLEAYGSTGGKL